ncbi:MAG: tRNA (cytidine(34)-2'-O)-methyltransferase [Deltaproteobacteria bacterium]|nr:tRNA (cytidine(34)-2'-O)-methyltransferase [Deltaproteobacteria bacterium]
MAFSINDIEHKTIENPALNVVLFQPEIPWNTGSIARLCAAAELRLHLIHPLGFHVDDKHLRRAGLDYWPEVDVVHHENFDQFLRSLERDGGKELLAFSKFASKPYTEGRVSRGDYLLFGRETTGLPEEIRATFPCYRVPIWGKVRSLNLSTTVGIVTYHYLCQMGMF